MIETNRLIIRRHIFAVVLKGENKVIGHLYFHRTEPKEFLTRELGFIFNPNYQNRGFCTEASKNIASWKVLEKIGMKNDGS